MTKPASKEQKGAAKLPPNAGKGRVKGIPNKVTGDVKAMILEALRNAGGAEYLFTQAFENPKAFLALVGKVLPLQVTGGDGKELQFTITMSEKEADL